MKKSNSNISICTPIKKVLPSKFIGLARWLRDKSRKNVEWEYIPEGWSYLKTHPQVKGWNVPEVLETYKNKWPQFVKIVQGSGPLGVTNESSLSTNEDIYGHNIMMSFAYILALAARKKDRLSMLDWGGGIGHYYVVARALHPQVEIEYHCKDVPILINYGKQLFPKQFFHSDNSCLNQTYDFVLASVSLQYTQDWYSTFRRLAGATLDYFYVAQLPVVNQVPSFVFIQRPYKYGYNTEYLGWCINKTEFLHCAERLGLHLVREFVYGYQPFIHGAPEQNEYRGFLFRKIT